LLYFKLIKEMADQQWQPSPAELDSTFRVLQALRDPSRPDHLQAMQGLDSFCGNGSFILHLLYIFVHGAGIPVPSDIRALGGFILKNYALKHLDELPAVVVYKLKADCLSALCDSVPDIVNTTGIIFGTLTKDYPIEKWGEILPRLFEMLDSGDAHVVDGALQAMKRICEDSCEQLLAPERAAGSGNSPLDALVPRLLNLFTHPAPSIRLRSIQSMNALLKLIEVPVEEEEVEDRWGNIVGKPRGMGRGREAFIIHINAFLQGISRLAEDPQPEVRLAVCQAIVFLASYQLAVLQPAFEAICGFMMNAARDAFQPVAMEACEYFAVLCENRETQQVLASSILPTLLPILVGHLRLSTEQMMQERADEEAQARGDKKLNIKPIHHKVSHQNNEDDEGANTQDGGNWTLRKQAAMLLDNLSTTFDPEIILPSCLPEIQRKLGSTDVWDRESGMLALGAMGTGCIQAMEPYLSSLYPFFLSSIRDDMLEMRSISCWVMARYSYALFMSDSGELSEENYMFANGVITSLMNAMVDPVHKVQSAGCSAMCTVLDYAGEHMIPYVPQLLATFKHCFQAYGLKSLMTLFDCIGVFADNVGSELDNPEYTPLIMPEIMR
jgi:transportin-1